MPRKRNAKGNANEPNGLTPGGFIKSCMMILENDFLGGRELGLPSDISLQLVAQTEINGNFWLGFCLDIPLGSENENKGFGMCYLADREGYDPGKAVPTQTYRLHIKLPPEKFTPYAKAADASMHKRNPKETENMSFLKIGLGGGSNLTVSGLGMPFANPGHPSEQWINHNEPIIDLPSDMLNQLWIKYQQPPAFTYPYGTQQHWSMGRYYEMRPRTKGHRFSPALSYCDDNDHIAVLTQSQVQDVFWLDVAAKKILTVRFRAYFVPENSSPISEATKFFYVILPLNQKFRDEYNAPWSRLTKGVDAVCVFAPDARPTNPVAQGIPKAGINAPIPFDLRDKMSLYRDLLLGNGFQRSFRLFCDSRGNVISQSPTQPIASPVLSVVNLLGIDEKFIDALLQDIVPSDHSRFCTYLSKRPLGLGIITAGPGFGKTTVLSVATLGMAASLGNVYATAATHVAADNFAERLNQITENVTRRRNISNGSTQSVRRALVIRGYKTLEETEAFHNLLKKPYMGDGAATWVPKSRWKVNLIVSLSIKRLLDVASGKIDWAEYKKGKVDSNEIMETLFRSILNYADILCTNAALSNRAPFRTWKIERAKGIAVDEASNISRPDLYCVWGNTLLSCVLAGDDKQLPPTVMSLKNRDGEGNHIDRLGLDGQISPLSFFKANGWPIFRLRTQFRMGTGLFDLCHRQVYSDVPLEYGPGCDISLEKHSAGRQLEAYLQQRFPNLTPAPAATFKEVFIHCKGAKCIVDSIDPAQVTIITPYKANVELIDRLRKKSKYSILSKMGPTATVDSFQGREGDIAVVVMGTTQGVGPGFTTDEQQLNVMFSRQRSGLVIFGDIKVLGKLVKDHNKDKKKFVIYTARGKRFVQAKMLHDMLTTMAQQGRVATLSASQI
ncbi:dna helicase [Trichoderma arundinaceum]|uniref:Dna helicase n=1 Tax=Trichoderma arundinaceum TaxID=490622 RepID=A0A395NHY7_TRIAR|nr:dna helicase [Trichoderma arundinaceum]